MAFQFTQTGQELQYLADEAEKIATEYDATASWITGDYCTHEGTIYRCTANTTGTFDATKWTAVILCDELEGLRSRMSTAEGDISSLDTSLAQFSNVLSGAAACGLTAQTGVTISKAYKLKIGQLVTYQIQMVLTSSATATNLITGFELPVGNLNGITGMVRALNNSSATTEYFVWVSETGILRTPSVGSADLRFAITYITAS